MPDRSFIDTNVLVYAYDLHEPEKQKRAQAILRDAVQGDCGVLSAQVLGEFFVTVTAKIPAPMAPEEAVHILTKTALPVVELDKTLVLRAIETHQSYSISYWDSLVVAAAERAGCAKILSEDMSDGQLYHGIPVENPFQE